MTLRQLDEAPHDVVVSRDRSTLKLSRPDDATEVFRAETLRLSCRCAWCTRDRIVDRFPERFEGIAISDVTPIGGHALHIVFSDGHARGIFPWKYLHKIASGATCPTPSPAAEAAL